MAAARRGEPLVDSPAAASAVSAPPRKRLAPRLIGQSVPSDLERRQKVTISYSLFPLAVRGVAALQELYSSVLEQGGFWVAASACMQQQQQQQNTCRLRVHAT
jgi:hypothetical protein